ncbi:MAG: flagellar basal body rod protein FlgB [Proteobacteria bacterium]|nr:MAG: flagellar basal body rod protein FlgB [Pseudomonadota bacterium]
MSISFEKALGIHERALQFRVKRAEVLANNLVNADTPGFKARDMDFKSVLDQQLGDSMAVSKTNSRHLAGEVDTTSRLKFRNAIQPSIDGNTVDTNIEIAEYTKNAMDYEATFQFLNSRFKGLLYAVKGE